MDGGDKPKITESIVSSINDIFLTMGDLLQMPTMARLKELSLAAHHTTQKGEKMTPITHADDICEAMTLYARLTIELGDNIIDTHSTIYVNDKLVMNLAAIDIDEVEIYPEDMEDDTIKEEFLQAIEMIAKILTALAIRVLQVTVKKEDEKNREEG